MMRGVRPLGVVLTVLVAVACSACSPNYFNDPNEEPYLTEAELRDSRFLVVEPIASTEAVATSSTGGGLRVEAVIDGLDAPDEAAVTVLEAVLARGAPLRWSYLGCTDGGFSARGWELLVDEWNGFVLRGDVPTNLDPVPHSLHIELRSASGSVGWSPLASQTVDLGSCREPLVARLEAIARKEMPDATWD